jgi:curved DNA-binding protein CbpA
MSDIYFREILGVAENATRDEIRQAYRGRVMENHPDRFPAEQKPLQELATIALTEAYNALMVALPKGEAGACADPSASAAPRPSAPPVERAGDGTPAAGAVSAHGDPAYAYYKQGFINFSLAIHGIADVNRKVAAGRVPRVTRHYSASDDIGSSLSLLRAAHGYFSRVVQRHPKSIWAPDARLKLRRIERFSRLYRRILTNLGYR